MFLKARAAVSEGQRPSGGASISELDQASDSGKRDYIDRLELIDPLLFEHNAGMFVLVVTSANASDLGADVLFPTAGLQTP